MSFPAAASIATSANGGIDMMGDRIFSRIDAKGADEIDKRPALTDST